MLKLYHYLLFLWKFSGKLKDKIVNKKMKKMLDKWHLSVYNNPRR